MFTKKKKTARNSFQSQRAPRRQLDTSFRRNTVVVSRSQRELKDYQQSVTQRQHDLKLQKRRRGRKIRLVTAVTLVGLFALCIRLQLGGVTAVAAPGYVLPREAADQYSATLQRLASDFTSAKQVWLLDESGLTTAAQQLHPEIAAIDFSHQAPVSTTIRATITFRSPEFVWRDANKQTQFVDADGILFGVNRVRGITTASLVHIEDQSGAVLDQGSSVLTRSLIGFVGSLPAELRTVFPGKQNRIKQVIIPQSIREIHVRFTGRPYIVKLSADRSLPEQVGELRSLIRYLEGRGTIPRSYIDLRTPLKAYYK